MSLLLGIFAENVPSDGGAWITSLVSGLGSAGVSTGILWKLHTEHVKRSAAREDVLLRELTVERAEKKALTNRLFLLADRGMAVGQTASEVVAGDARDPELLQQMQRLEALLEERGRR